MKHVHYGWVVCITCTLLLIALSYRAGHKARTGHKA